MSAPSLRTPDRLVGDHVVLERMAEHHVAAIAEAAAGDRSTYSYTGVPDGLAGAESYVRTLLAAAGRGEVAPFVQRRAGTELVVGCTRFMDPHFWFDRPDPDEVEIGGTWLNPAAQRSSINTEAKLLLLTHAFEAWGVGRVAICTDARNARSRTAIERIGATFEGVLRQHRTSYLEPGSLRDSAMFSIVAEEWPTVCAALRHRLDQ
jgi:RimJ/RimL family protein N-acetyltransferase